MKLRRIILSMTLVLAVSLMSVSALSQQGVGITVSLNELEAVNSAVPAHEGAKIVSQNKIFMFEYNEAGADVYVTDKRTGKVWSNVVDRTYYTEEITSQNFLTQLMTVRTASQKGNITQTVIYDREENKAHVDLLSEYLKGELILSVTLREFSIKFKVHMWIDEDGFNYSIPENEMEENGSNMLVSIQMMPTFGAAVSNEDGYIFLPDGSGSLIHFSSYDNPNAKLYSYPIYGIDAQDIQKIEETKQHDIYNMMLPVYGISHENGGMLAAITEGQADASIYYAPGGFQLAKLNRAYFSFNYRTYYSMQVEGKNVIQLIPYINAGTRSVKIFLLDDSSKDYNGMAVAYRNYLKKTGTLSKKSSSNTVNVAIDLFMGANEKGFLGNKFISTTTYLQAKEIIKELKEQISILQVTLLGWGKGGYDTLPTTSSPEHNLGGAKELSNLMKYCRENKTNLYLNMDFVNANDDTGLFNKRSDVARYSTGKIVNYENKYMLNPSQVMMKFYEKAIDKIGLKNITSLRFDTVGNLLSYDFSKENPTSRNMAQKTYESVLEKASEQLGNIAVSGGNQYVLPYASVLYNIPDTHSDYYIGGTAIPFYQMVVHGYINYCSTPGNQSYDLQTQKLKWIETGSIPYFILTYDNPVVLNNSSYNELFSSQYSVWKNDVIKTVLEFRENFESFWNEPISKHEIIGGVARITYEGGTQVYVNYADDEVTVGDVTVPAMNYVIVKEALR